MAILHPSEAQSVDQFGFAVAISGDIIVVGAPFEDGGPGDPFPDAGAAYIFMRNQGGADAWGQVAILRSSEVQAGDEFGFSVALNGDTVVVGAPFEDGGPGDLLYDAGAAYVFMRNQGGSDAWGQVATLHPSERQVLDGFGGSVALDGETAAVGAACENGGPGDPFLDAGAAYIFARNQGGADAWGQVATLRSSEAQAYDAFGNAIGLDGDIAAVGARGEDGGPGDPLYGAGAAYVFMRDQGGTDAWGQVAILHSNEAQAGDGFGFRGALSGDTIVIAAPFEDGGPGDPLSAAGAVYIFARNQGGAGAWGQVATLRSSDVQANDNFGISVACSGTTIIAGAELEDGGPGDPIWATGAAYVFSGENPPADLSIAKSVAPSIAAPGSTITYTLVFTNNGPGPATGVVISDALPVSMTVQSVANSGAAITDTGALPPYAWQVADLGVGQGGTITITAEISANLPCGYRFSNTAVITGTGDLTLTNNSSAAALTIGNLAGIDVTPPTGSASGEAGNLVTYSLRLTNTGNCTDTLDVAVTAAWTTTAAATVGPLEVGGSVEVPVTVTIPLGAHDGDWDVATITFASRVDGKALATNRLTTTVVAEPWSTTIYLPLMLRGYQP